MAKLNAIEVRASANTDWVKWSVVVQLVLFSYYQLIEWVNIFPWNDIRKGNGQAAVDWIVAGVMLVLLLITLLRRWWAMIAPALLFGLWLWLQFDSWWLPYIQGASPGWKRAYGRFFGETVKFLPTFGNHLAPDACHIVLQLLVASALVTTILAAVQVHSRRFVNT